MTARFNPIAPAFALRFFFAASTDGPALRFDTHVPIDLIERGMSAALQIKMQMERNPGGAGAGLGAGVGN